MSPSIKERACTLFQQQNTLVSAENVTEPKNVRFGWQEIVNPNLSNKEGLPASPFRTDDWKGSTGQ